MKKREDGRYKKQITIGRGPDGARVFKYLYGSTKKELEAKIKDFENQRNAGIRIGDENTTFQQASEMWLGITTIHIVPGTRKMYETALYRHLIPDIGGYRLKDLKPYHLQVIVNRLAKEGYSVKTIKTIKNTAGRVMEFSADNDLIAKNPFKRITLPRGEKNGKRRALTAEEQKIILDSYGKHRMSVPAILMMCCGLRRGEIMALEWKDIDTDNKYITVNKAVMINNNKTEVKAPKTEAGNRRVPIAGILLDKLAYEKGEAKSDMVCPSAAGDRMTETAFRRAWKSYEHYLNITAGGKDASRSNPKVVRVEHITPHMLRHTYATMLYDAGVDVKNAQRYLGHEDVLTTLRIYTHLSQEKEKIGDASFDLYLQEHFK